jgi:hypothetical protein
MQYIWQSWQADSPAADASSAFLPPLLYPEPDFGLPDFGLPDFGLPDFGLPDFGLPDFGLPDFGLTAGFVGSDPAIGNSDASIDWSEQQAILSGMLSPKTIGFEHDNGDDGFSSQVDRPHTPAPPVDTITGAISLSALQSSETPVDNDDATATTGSSSGASGSSGAAESAGNAMSSTPTSVVSVAGSGLVFDNYLVSGLPAAFISDITAAETLLATLFKNTVTISIGFDAVNEGNTGDYSFNDYNYVDVSYSQLTDALKSHAYSYYAQAAVASLPANSPAGNQSYTLPDAYARMLGLSTATGTYQIENNQPVPSGGILDDVVFLNTFYDPTYGQDVINALTHEISEGGMGRIGGMGAPNNDIWSTMDLFRFNGYGALDDTNGKDGDTTYFSYNGGTTLSSVAGLSFNNQYDTSKTQVNTGDTADWTQQDVFGVTDSGETNPLSQPDISIMDTLGWDPTTLPTPAPYDFTGIGISDILLQNSDGSIVDWTMTDATIDYGQSLTFQGAPAPLSTDWWIAGAGDLSGNGITDLLLRNTGGSVFDWVMDGSTIAADQELTFQGASVDLPTSYSIIGVGNFNGSPDADILLLNSNGQMVDWQMSGSTITSALAITYQGAAVDLPSNWSVAGIGDFNGGTTSDILLTNTNGGIFLWTMNGNQIAQDQSLRNVQGTAVTLPSSYFVAGVGDFMGNGFSDILLEGTGGSLAEWQMEGSTIETSAAVTYQGNAVDLPASWSIAEVGDFNGGGPADVGNSDILLVNSNGSMVIWFMNGAAIADVQAVNIQGAPVDLPSSWTTETNPSTDAETSAAGGATGVQSASAGSDSDAVANMVVISSGETVTNPTITNGTLLLSNGATVDGTITFAPGSTGTLFDADASPLVDTVVGFNEGSTHLSFFGENPATEAQVIASAQAVNGNTVLTYPDHTSLVLVGVTHVDAGIFA